MTRASVELWGTRIGAVTLNEGAGVADFQYTPDFVDSGRQVSPITMPLDTRVYSFPTLPRDTFHGLPGLLADSLPDRYGNALIDTWLATPGRSPGSFDAVERLCYTGKRGMGALEFTPATGPRVAAAKKIEIDALVSLASEVLSHRAGLAASFATTKRKSALQDILRVGTSAGGARAKALIAWNPGTNEVRSGQVAADEGFGYWLLKFDGVSGNKDKELEDPKGYGAIEYAYSLMAKAAGVTMTECRLLEENNRRHFMTRRFDRTSDGGKRHAQSLCALAHYDFNNPTAYSYEQAFLVIRQLGLSMEDVEQQFRRMAFNVVARNQDDRAGRWSLAPAFDVTYAYNATGDWTAKHQMSINGKRDGFTLGDFRACAETAQMKRGRAETILEEVRSAVEKWLEYADKGNVAPALRDQIKEDLRLKIPD